MFRRSRPALFMGVLCVLMLTSCNRDKKVVTEPAGPATDQLFLVARVKLQEIRKSPLLANIAENLAKKGGGEVTLEVLEQQIEPEMGFKLINVDSVTLCFPDWPEYARDENKLIALVTFIEPIDKDRVFGRIRRGESNRPDFIAMRDEMFLHIPDDKTAAVMHESLIDSYLAGFAKNRKHWPLSDEFVNESDKHQLFLRLRPSKLPNKGRDSQVIQPYLPIFDAKSIDLAFDFKEKGLHLGVNGKFNDDAAAAKAKESVLRARGELSNAINQLISGSKEDSANVLTRILVEAKRAIDEGQIETSGKDLNVSAIYQAEIPFVAEIILTAVNKVREAAARTKDMNNLSQMGMAMHLTQDVNGFLPVAGMGKNGALVIDEKGKALLSWRVAILPFIEQRALYEKFKLDEPWDSEHNKKLIEFMPRIYASNRHSKTPANQTRYQIIRGPKALQPGTRIENIQDGASNTLIIVEAAQPVIWTKPDDLLIPDMEMPKDLKKKLGGLPDGFLGVAGDGGVRLFDFKRNDDQNIWRLIVPDDGQNVKFFSP
ncbi:MAG: DUF1559 domain-containing protein [Planctomycetes bacterium]|nr:DUF1559 domain-containing protein [Planctomycetota bacterium]